MGREETDSSGMEGTLGRWAQGLLEGSTWNGWPGLASEPGRKEMRVAGDLEESTGRLMGS